MLIKKVREFSIPFVQTDWQTNQEIGGFANSLHNYVLAIEEMMPLRKRARLQAGNRISKYLNRLLN